MQIEPIGSDGGAVASASIRSVIQRYYQPYFALDVAKKEGEDQVVYKHSNGLFVIGIAPTHPIIRLRKQVSVVDYNVTKQSRLQNKVYGKGKKGGLWMEPLSPLCDVTCSDGSKYRLYSCIRGHLLEVNENLVQRPELLSSSTYSTEGYLGIVNPKHVEQETVLEKLVPLEVYRNVRK